MKISVLILILFGTFITGCHPCSECHLTTSATFNGKQHSSLLILPVLASGHPELTVLPTYADDIATVFIEKGFTVIDRSAAFNAANKLGIDLNKGIQETDVPKLASSLNVDAVYLQTARYVFIPAESGSTPASFSLEKDKRGRVTDISASGGGSYAYGEHYEMTSMSARIFDARTNAVLLSAYTQNASGIGAQERLIDMIKDKLDD